MKEPMAAVRSLAERKVPSLSRARAIPEPQAPRDAPLEGVVLDAANARKRARDEAFRASPDGAMMRAIMANKNRRLSLRVGRLRGRRIRARSAAMVAACRP